MPDEARPDPYRHDHDDEGMFVVILEGGPQGPIILETEGQDTSRQAAERRAHLNGIGGPGRRWCIARLTYASGNALLFKQTKDMQP